MKTVLSCWATVALFFGILLSTVGVFLLSYLPSQIDEAVRKDLQIRPGSKTFEHWPVTPVPMYIDIYFFNWTNPAKLGKEKPHFTEMGPYRFYEKRTKVGLVWHPNKTVSFKQTRHWYFDPENTKGSLKDKVTTVDVVSLTATRISKYISPLEKVSLSFTFTLLNQRADSRRTVEELLFSGYYDKFLATVGQIPFLTKGAKISDKVGWFYKRNGTDAHDGVFNINTGEDDVRKLGKIMEWNHKNTTGFFRGRCGEVAGSTGEVFTPGLTPQDRLQIFSPDLCRTINLDYTGEEEVEGLTGYRFSGGVDLVDSGKLKEENSCFCDGECTPTGLLNLTRCRDGAPLFVSYPHFYLGESELTDQVSGLKPDPEKHSFHITVEPTLGVPMDVKGRFQMNLLMDPDDDVRMYRELPNRVYMPIMWFDLRASLTEPLAQELRLPLLVLSYWRQACLGILLMGLVLLLLSLVGPIRHVLASDRQKPHCMVLSPTSSFTTQPLIER